MGNEKMNWIYEGVSGLVDKEEYLTGRRVDKTFEIAQLEKEGNISDFNHSDRNVSSLFESKGKLSKLDLELKLKEDPLQSIKRRQAELIKEILNNPIKMRRIKHLLEESLRKEKEEKKLRKKMKKKAKKEKKMQDDSRKEINMKIKKERRSTLSEIRNEKREFKEKYEPSGSGYRKMASSKENSKINKSDFFKKLF